ncbi:hypothetical protein TNCV_2570231 [Trichonephila clavipes]|nr:hypothetical protein TNCV_2570231 [Trichonephila clavipes]
MATGSYLTPTYSRSQSEVQGDLHKIHFTFWKECISEWVKTVELGLGRSHPYQPASFTPRHPHVMESTGDILVSSDQA